MKKKKRKEKKKEEDKFALRGVILNLNLFTNTDLLFYWKHDTNLTNILKKQTQLRIDT